MGGLGELAPALGALRRRARSAAITSMWIVAGLLPLVGFLSLLLRSQLDPHFENYRAHFVVFGIVGGFVFVLGYRAGEAANRRADARVFLLSLAFMTTGGFLGLHALGTRSVLFSKEHAGFQVAIPVGLLLSSAFAAGSAFIDRNERFGLWLMRYRGALHAGVLLVIGAWFVWTVADLPPLSNPGSEAARDGLLAVLEVVGTVVYAASAARYWELFRRSRKLLPAAVVGCFVLLSEALIGVAVTGERKWHASWWEWHGLIVTAFLIIGLAARREWHEERFRELYLASTRERRQEISVLFADLIGYTAYSDRATPAQAAEVLNAYWGIAAPLIALEFGGEVEKFIGDGVVATFNSRGDQPDHALRAARAALELQERFAVLSRAHPEWPSIRIGINSGEVVLREIGGYGHVAYPLVGDTVNTGARLESLAPAGGVLIGSETYDQLPHGAEVEARSGLRVKGKADAVQAYVLLGLPA
jgi:class 3 adenylate cyclase